jgi:hypothetical protein
MTDELDQYQADQRVQAFLDLPEHKVKAHGKPEHVEDDVSAAIEAEKEAGPPDWVTAKRDAPHGWHKTPDGFEAD